MLPSTRHDYNSHQQNHYGSETSMTHVARGLLLLLVTIYLYLLISWNFSIRPFTPLTPAPGLPNPSSIDLDLVKVDWSRFAYAQYVTNAHYLCNSIMIFESLHRFKARANKFVMYPQRWDVRPDNESNESRLLLKAHNEYGVDLVPAEILRSNDPESTWIESFSKLLVFNQTQYDRIISLDSDATVLQPMDELFLLPPAPVAMPRAYWLPHHTLSSQLMVVSPSLSEFNRLLELIRNHESNHLDMDIVNDLYGEHCIIIPHRKYDLLSGEFRGDPDHHAAYLGSEEEHWNGTTILEEAKYIHFSDWPYPKPWYEAGGGMTDGVKPKCRKTAEAGWEDCIDQEIWLGLYDDFRRRRHATCDPPES